MTQLILTKLSFAKYIFREGCSILERNQEITDGLAVSLFQDAVETLLRAIAQSVNAQISENSHFHEIINKINSASENKKGDIPFRSILLQLNKSRVNFKHFGLLPNSTDAYHFRNEIERFFYQVIPQFFPVNYENISLVELVPFCRIKNYLKKSEEALSDLDYRNSMALSSQAVCLIEHMIKNTPYSEHARDLRIDSNSLKSIELYRALRGIVERVNAHHNAFYIVKYGINLFDYEKFYEITPRAFLSELRTVKIASYNISYSSEYETEENAVFCLRFAVNFALSIKNNPYFRRDRLKPDRNFEVLQNSNIFAYIHNSDKEMIREAKAGEILEGYYPNHDKDDYIAICQDNDLAYIHQSAVKEIK